LVREWIVPHLIGGRPCAMAAQAKAMDGGMLALPSRYLSSVDRAMPRADAACVLLRCRRVIHA
jgi:hypothetical protein